MEIYKNLSLENLPNEEWRDIVDYKGLYQVSNLGRVKSLGRKKEFGIGRYERNAKILTPIKDGRGYFMVNLHKDYKAKIHSIHRLVAQAFIPNPNNYRCIDHINTIKIDNRVENLKWCTHSMNMRNPITKAYIDSKRTKFCLEDWYREKQRYSQPHSKRVLQFNLDNSFIKEWKTISEAARAMGVSIQAISRCCNGVVKTSKNYIWKFK